MGGGPVATYIKPVTSPPLCPWGRYPSGGTHRALDYPVVTGTKFRVARAGVVKVAGWSTTGFGNHIRVLLDDGNTVIYGHLSKFYVRVGQRVSAGQFIGETGNSGNSTGPHLHMEVRSSSYAPWTAWDFTSRLIDAPMEDDMFNDQDRLNLNRALSAINGFRSEEADRYSYYAGKLNTLIAEHDAMAKELAALKAKVDAL